MIWWQRLFPKYGNWGGPGWSGGCYPERYTDTNWNVPAVDSLDELFKCHDKDYQQAIKQHDERDLTDEQMREKFVDADKWLVLSVDEFLAPNPKDWIATPSNMWYAWLYRKLVLIGFYPRIWVA